MEKEEKKLSAKQINNIIDTYRKNDRDAYNEIIMIADQMGIATKAAFKKSSQVNNRIWISQSKNKKIEKKRQELYEKISEMYAKTYTEYEKKLKVKYKKYRDEIRWQGENPLPMKKYFKARKYINEMYSSLFDAIDSDLARVVVEVTEDKFYKGNDKDALNYLDNQFEYYKSRGAKFKNVPQNPFK